MFGAIVALVVVMGISLVVLTVIVAVDHIDEGVIAGLMIGCASFMALICGAGSIQMYRHVTGQAHYEMRPAKEGGTEWVEVNGPATREER